MMNIRKLPWTEKFRPSSQKEVVGNTDSIHSFVSWVQSWSQGYPKKRAALLVGPPGVGKTAIVGAVANDFDLELVEFNASDKRNKDNIEVHVSRAAMQHTLDGRGRIILLDEVDGLSGTSDRGGVSAILKIIEYSAHPIVMTANDPKSPRLKDLMKRCNVFHFEPVDDESVMQVLLRISKGASSEISEEMFGNIVARAGGDLRAAISDLEAVIEGRLDEDEISLGTRDVRRTIVQTLRRLFMVTDSGTARMVVSEGNVDHDSLLLWLEENLHLHLSTPSELELGLDALSNADMYLGRIMRQQNWKLLSYVYDFLSSGIASSRRKTPYRRVEYTEPLWPLLIWKGRKKRESKEDLISKLAPIAGVSTTRAYEKCIRTIESIIEISPKQLGIFAEWLAVSKKTFGRKSSRG
ncbi:MAG: replication factor C large subunit [Candidatus Thorarchaeota archaeon]|jgi:replication factor C large subunit